MQPWVIVALAILAITGLASGVHILFFLGGIPLLVSLLGGDR